MVSISIEGDRVRFEVRGMDKLWAFKSQLEIPLAHVAAARIDPHPARDWIRGVRMPGTELPGVIRAGTYYTRDGTVFFDVHNPEQAIVVELNHERYTRLVVEVDDPAAAVEMLEKAIGFGQGERTNGSI